MSDYTYNSEKSNFDNKNMPKQEGDQIDNLEEYMNQHPEIVRGSFLGEWTEEMTEQLTAGLVEIESEEMDNHYHINEWNDEDNDDIDVEDDGIIDDGTVPVHGPFTAEDIQQYFAHHNDQSLNSIDHNNDIPHQDEYDSSFDPHLNW